MPTYEYRCPACEIVSEIVHSIKEDPVFHCTVCSTDGKTVVLERMISKGIGFTFKEWTEPMSYKMKREKRSLGAKLETKQIERYGSGPRLQPNVGGVEVDSWSDAQKVAKECGMNESSYEGVIEKEKKTSKISGVDDAKWKAAKEKA